MFNLPKASQYGFWGMAHESRTDFSMILGSLFLLLVGAGCRWFSVVLVFIKQPVSKPHCQVENRQPKISTAEARMAIASDNTRLLWVTGSASLLSRTAK